MIQSSSMIFRSDYEKEQELQLEDMGIDVMKSPFGAKGDGVTDDTIAIQNAIDYCYSKGGGTVLLPSRKFLINSITVKANVRLKFGDFRRPYLGISTTDFSSYTMGFVRPENSTSHGVIAERWSYLENIMVFGGNKTVENYGIYVEHEAFAENVYCSHGYHGIYINDANIDGVFAVGNSGDGITFFECVDIWIRRFLASSNGGQGLVFDACSTMTLTQGKSEWNRKNNVYTINYCQELNWNDCIIDSANWFNIYCRNSAYNFRFNDVMFIGSRFGTNGPEMTADDLPGNDHPAETILAYCQIFTQTSNFGAVFNNCYFRRNNLATGDSTNDRVTSILGFKDGLIQKTPAIRFTGCDNPRLRIVNPDYDIANIANVTHDGTMPNQPVGIMQADGITPTTETAPIDPSTKYYYFNEGCTIRAYPVTSTTFSSLQTAKLLSGVLLWDSTNRCLTAYDSVNGIERVGNTIYMGQDNVLLATSIGDIATYPLNKIIYHNVTNAYATSNGFPEGIGGILKTFNITTLYTIRHQEYMVGNYGTSTHKIYKRFLTDTNAWTLFIQMPGNVLDFTQVIGVQTIPVNGGLIISAIATVGSASSDIIYASPIGVITPGLTWQAYTTGTDTIKLSFTNVTTATITLASMTWNIKIQK